MRACVRACACVCACVRACVRACVCVCVVVVVVVVVSVSGWFLVAFAFGKHLATNRRQQTTVSLTAADDDSIQSKHNSSHKTVLNYDGLDRGSRRRNPVHDKDET